MVIVALKYCQHACTPRNRDPTVGLRHSVCFASATHRAENEHDKAQIRQKVTETEDAVETVEKRSPDPDSTETASEDDGEPGTETPLERIVSLPEHVADRELTVNQERARFIATELRRSRPWYYIAGYQGTHSTPSPLPSDAVVVTQLAGLWGTSPAGLITFASESSTRCRYE